MDDDRPRHYNVGAFKKARDDANRLSYRDHNIRGDRTLRGVAAMSNEQQHIIRDALTVANRGS